MIRLVVLFALVAVSLGAPQYGSASSKPIIPILRLDNDIYPDGSYRYAYETGNGISAEEQGQQKAIGQNYGNAAQGSYRYTSPEGLVVEIQYIADENGFQPVGNVIPTTGQSAYSVRQPQRRY